MASSKNRPTSASIERVLGRPVILRGEEKAGEQEVFREQRLKRAGAHDLLVLREPLVCPTVRGLCDSKDGFRVLAGP